jgi:hypothetical protein
MKNFSFSLTAVTAVTAKVTAVKPIIMQNKKVLRRRYLIGKEKQWRWPHCP